MSCLLWEVDTLTQQLMAHPISHQTQLFVAYPSSNQSIKSNPTEPVNTSDRQCPLTILSTLTNQLPFSQQKVLHNLAYFTTSFTSSTTSRTYKIRFSHSCDSIDIIYQLQCQQWLAQYIGLTTEFVWKCMNGGHRHVCIILINLSLCTVFPITRMLPNVFTTKVLKSLLNQANVLAVSSIPNGKWNWYPSK